MCSLMRKVKWQCDQQKRIIMSSVLFHSPRVVHLIYEQLGNKASWEGTSSETFFPNLSHFFPFAHSLSLWQPQPHPHPCPQFPSVGSVALTTPRTAREYEGSCLNSPRPSEVQATSCVSDLPPFTCLPASGAGSLCLPVFFPVVIL